MNSSLRKFRHQPLAEAGGVGSFLKALSRIVGQTQAGFAKIFITA